MIEIKAVGGYEEVGRNMTAVKIGKTVLLLDMGLELESYVNYIENEDVSEIRAEELILNKAIPNDNFISAWTNYVKAIIPTHAHLDHIGAIPFLASKYKASIIGTPFTIEVLKRILRDNNFKIKNQLRTLNANSIVKISEDISLEFVGVTHSTPQTVMLAIHTNEGVIVYANDYKFDNFPVLGKKSNTQRLKELGREGVLALIVDSTRAGEQRKTPSESVARDMLRDVMLGTDNKHKIMIVTTFSSHLARLKSIVRFGERLGRKIVFLGRSLSKYVGAGDSIHITNFRDKVKIIQYSDKIKKFLKNIEDSERGDYLLVVTGHQGEPNSVLSKMVDGTFKFKFYKEEPVIFSCRTIPTKTNIKNRKRIEEKLLKKGVRLFKDIHVSGHASKEDHRDLIKMLKPQHIIPAHGTQEMAKSMKELGLETGFDNVHLMRNGSTIKIK